MADQDFSTQDPTAGYTKVPKGPNFLLIVIAFAVTILVGLFLAVLFLRHTDKNIGPHTPNPTPNSLVVTAPGYPQELPTAS